MRSGSFDRVFEVKSARAQEVLIGCLRNPQTIKRSFDRVFEDQRQQVGKF